MGIEKLSGVDRVTVPAHLMSPRGGDHYVLRVVGDALESEHLCDGDYVIVLRRQVWEDGEACVCLVGDEATIKRLYSAGDGKVRLQPIAGPANSGEAFPSSGSQSAGRFGWRHEEAINQERKTRENGARDAIPFRRRRSD